MIDPERLRRIANWSLQLSEPEFDRARAAIREKRYSQGVTICEEGREYDWAGVVDGLVKLRSLSADGRDVFLTGIHAGGWFGEGSVLKGEARRYDVVALRDTTMALLDRKTLYLWLFENSAAFSRYLVGQLNERLGYFIGMVENDRMLDPTARVARALASMMNPILFPDVGRRIMITQEEMGLLAGVSRPIANQALKKLERDGILRGEYAGVTVLNLDAL